MDEVRLETLVEGRCAQTPHVGSFGGEAEALRRMHHEFVPERGLRMAGRHHEVHLSDLRRVAPERQRTLLRQPVAAATG
ncbi:GyrI-like domain-containing protein [Nocardiopsis sp. FR6]|uniref:GyrI-like domain-containing protein n=1 Tax=unclassified Nocardiopsis TaxID=2649073 RepID=UPI00351A53C1